VRRLHGTARKGQALNPAIKTLSDHRLMLEEKELDAVLIATPQHALPALRRLARCGQACVPGEDHGLHRGARQEDARGIQAVKGSSGAGGHQACSSGHVIDAKSYLEGGKLGKITAVDATMYRNTPHGKPQWARAPRGPI